MKIVKPLRNNKIVQISSGPTHTAVITSKFYRQELLYVVIEGIDIGIVFMFIHNLMIFSHILTGWSLFSQKHCKLIG